jgi:hypothetical protein
VPTKTTLQRRLDQVRHELDVLHSDPSAGRDRIGKLEDYARLGLQATDTDWKVVKALIHPLTQKMY